MTSPVDTLKALAERAIPFLRDEADKYEDDGSNEPLELIRDIDAAIAALSDAEQIRTVMRIEHEGRTFSVDGWAGPLVLGWRNTALSGGEAPVGYAYFAKGSGNLCLFNDYEARFPNKDLAHVFPLYTTPRAVGDGMVGVPMEPTIKEATP